MLAQIPMKDDRKTGYNFMDEVLDEQGNVVAYHPGYDLNSGNTGNADLGLDVRPVSKGIVEWIGLNQGAWGNMLWIYHRELSEILGYRVWTRMSHFQKILVKVGQEVDLHTIIGLCGGSGGVSPHCHVEVITQMLPTRTKYVNYWSKAKVLKYFVDLYEFVEMVNNLVEIPEWADNDFKELSALGIIPDDPHKMINMDNWEKHLLDKGFITTSGDMPGYRFAVLLQKISNIIGNKSI